MAFEITTADGEVERVEGADSYELEGPLTTFFAVDGAHARLSAWSVRIASIRTDRIASVRRVDDEPRDVELRAAS
jgi:hypothetical protein